MNGNGIRNLIRDLSNKVSKYLQKSEKSHKTEIERAPLCLYWSLGLRGGRKGATSWRKYSTGKIRIQRTYKLGIQSITHLNNVGITQRMS